MKFKRSIGFWGMVLAAVSGMLGSGWLFAPYYASQIAGPSALFSWVIGAVFTLLIAFTFAELTSMFPVSGSQARFMEFSHGTLASFVCNVMMWLGYMASAPTETMGILRYLSLYFPHLVQTKADVIVLSHQGYEWAVLLLLAISILNFSSIKWLSRYNAAMTWLKIGLPLILIIILISFAFNAGNLSSSGFFAGGMNGAGKALSSGGIIYSYIGFSTALMLAGEGKNIQKSIPFVLLVSVFVCMIVYFLAQLAFIGALNPQALSQGWAHLSFSHDASPFIGIIQAHHLNVLDNLVFITAIVAPLGTAIIFIASTARVTYAMAENSYFPKIFLHLSKKGVPTVAVALNFALGLLLFFPAPGWQGMVSFLVSAFVLSYAIGPVSLLALRKQLPNQPRPYRLPFARIWCLASFFVSNLILYWAGWKPYCDIMIFLAFALVVFMLGRMLHSELRAIKLDAKRSLWVFAYLIIMGMICYLGAREPEIPFKDDVVLIFIASCLILILAEHTRLPIAKINTGGASMDANNENTFYQVPLKG